MFDIISREALVETFLRLGRALVEVPEGERAWLEGEVAGLIVHFSGDFLEIVATAKEGAELRLSMWLDELSLHPPESPLRRELGDFLTKLAEVPRAFPVDPSPHGRGVAPGAKDARGAADSENPGVCDSREEHNFSP
jgi:hypothetical protein